MDNKLATNEQMAHYQNCMVVQKNNLWSHVMYIRGRVEKYGHVSSEHENMLDVEFVAIHHDCLPSKDNTLLELYYAWLKLIDKLEEEETPQCQSPMINITFTRQ